MNAVDNTRNKYDLERNVLKRKFYADYKDFLYDLKVDCSTFDSIRTIEKESDRNDSDIIDYKQNPFNSRCSYGFEQESKRLKLEKADLSDLIELGNTDDFKSEEQIPEEIDSIDIVVSSWSKSSKELSNMKRFMTPPASANILDFLSTDMLMRCVQYFHHPSDLWRLSQVCTQLTDLVESDIAWRDYFRESVLLLPMHGAILPQPHRGQSYDPHDNNETRKATDDGNLSLNIDTWICVSCSLIQALQSSTMCEFCSTPRPEIHDNPTPTTSDTNMSDTPYIVISSPSQLSALWTQGRLNSEQQTMNRERNLYGSHRMNDHITISSSSNIESSNNIILGKEKFYFHPTHIELQSRFNDDINDWYQWPCHVALPRKQVHALRSEDSCRSLSMLKYRCKIQYLDHKLRNRWEMLSAGWEWTSRELRRILRMMWRSGSTSATVELSATSNNLRRIFCKLARKDWSLCYDSIKYEIELQAEGIYRDLCGKWDFHDQADLHLHQCIDYIRDIIRSCEVIMSWGEVITEHAYELSDYISDDQDIRRGCRNSINDDNGDEGNDKVESSLSIPDMCLLALRNQVFLKRKFQHLYHIAINYLEAYSDIKHIGSDVRASKSIHHDTIQLLLQLHNLLELIGAVADEGGSNISPSKSIFHKRCIASVEAIVSLAPHIRDKSQQMDDKVDEMKYETNVGSLMEIFDDSNPSSLIQPVVLSGVIYKQTLLKRLES